MKNNRKLEQENIEPEDKGGIVDLQATQNKQNNDDKGCGCTLI